MLHAVAPLPRRCTVSRQSWGRAFGAFPATAAVIAAAPTIASAGQTPTAADQQQRPTVAAPTVSGPVTGGTHGFPFTSSSVDLRSHGYAEQEFFFSGTAHSFTSAQPLTSDGKWQVQQAAAAPYESRMIVRAPTDPAKFNGTVIVEW